MKKTEIRALTYGAMIAAIYVVLLLIFQSILQPDSIVIYLLPVPIAVYTYKYGIKYGVLVSIVTTFASFLFLNPIIVLILVLANTLVGSVYGYLDKFNSRRIINLALLFIVFLTIDVVTTFGLAKLFNYDFIEDTKSLVRLMQGIIPIKISEDRLYDMVVKFIPAVFIISDLLRVFFTSIIYEIIVYNLKYRMPRINGKLLCLRRNYKVGLAYILSLVILFFSVLVLFKFDNIVVTIILNLEYVFIILFSLLIIMQTIMFLSRKYNSSKSFIISLLISLGSIILFPISLVFGVVLNFIK